jgi:hypothetical protein
MKHIWHAMMMIHSFSTFPASFIVLIYSVGAMVLLGQWQLFLWALVAFVAACVVETFLAVYSE